MNRLITFTLLSFLITSCATSNIANDYISLPESGSGLAIGTITHNEASSSLILKYRSLSNGFSGFFEFNGKSQLNPAHKDNNKGKLITVELPQGSYEIYAWSANSASYKSRSALPFSIKFDVLPEKAVYLGNFHFSDLNGKGLSSKNARVDFSEKSKRDIELFRLNYPNLQKSIISSSILAGTRVKNLGDKYRFN